MTARVAPDAALEHPRRWRLLEYIRAHPGGTFREVLRGTGIPAGTARHHLNVLGRTGFIMEKRHRSTLRFFPNRDEYVETWDTVVLLREPPLGRLHSWILDHPECMQKQILEAMEVAGWSRSTTQHRLNRLLDAGLVTMRPQGRINCYTAHATAQRVPRRGSWDGLSLFASAAMDAPPEQEALWETA